METAHFWLLYLSTANSRNLLSKFNDTVAYKLVILKKVFSSTWYPILACEIGLNFKMESYTRNPLCFRVTSVTHCRPYWLLVCSNTNGHAVCDARNPHLVSF